MSSVHTTYVDGVVRHAGDAVVAATSSSSDVRGNSTATVATPFARSNGTTLSQHHAPCQAPCTSTTVARSVTHGASHRVAPGDEERSLRVVRRERDRGVVRI